MINKAILMLAFYELLYEKDTPKAVVINEALELAKRYSDPESARFINGILDSAVV
jgi:N utilization substance protein B